MATKTHLRGLPVNLMWQLLLSYSSQHKKDRHLPLWAQKIVHRMGAKRYRGYPKPKQVYHD